MFSGSIPALVTPFTDDGQFDEAAYRALVDLCLYILVLGLLALLAPLLGIHP